MRRLSLLLLLFALPSGAQVQAGPSRPVQLLPGMAALAQGWRTHTGDNPAWAQTSLDDSTWQTISLTATNDYAGWRWYRLRAELPTQHPPLALLVTGGSGTYEVYVNGQPLHGPRLHSPFAVTYPQSRIVPLPAVSGQSEIALRTHIPATSMFIGDRDALRVAIGTVTAIHDAYGSEHGTRLDQVVLGVGAHLLPVLAGLVMLALFWYERSHREYLWLGIYLLLDGGGTIIYELVLSGFLPFSLNWFGSEVTFYIGVIAQIEFTFSFIDQRVTRPWRIYESILLIPVFMLVPAWLGFLSRGLFNVDEVLIVVPAAIGLPALLLLWYRRGNREAGWLILPSLLPMFTVVLNDAGIVGAYLHWPRIAGLFAPFSLGVFSVEPFDIGDLVFFLAIGFVMFFRFIRVSREQARSAAELNAARELQQRLVPLSLPEVPGCRIEAAYLPAEEVGGDFYQILGQPGGPTLIVIGDVSGKGLKAAMTGTLVLGALRTLAAEGLRPATLLARLNLQLVAGQDGGFVTCLCAHIAPDGALTLANAGHLAPYRNGQEVSVDPGLPLGVTADTTYAESAVQLAPRDALAFLSDGVVEAQSATGEMFGFDRTRAISVKSADEIAVAAQAHGQQDDITVLTLTFAPAEVAHA
jgi:phosphoserine phosphatase RsbU/P